MADGPFTHPAMEGLKGPLSDFHDACQGRIEDVAMLFASMSGQMLPVPIIAQLLGVDLSAPPPVLVPKAQFLHGVDASLDDDDTAEKHTPVIKQAAEKSKQRAEAFAAREAVELDEEKAMEFEGRIFAKIKASDELSAITAELKEAHDAWRSCNEEEKKDPKNWPCATMGPMILTMFFDRVLGRGHFESLDEAALKAFHMTPEEDTVGFLMSKMAPQRAAKGGPVAIAQVERIVWAAEQATGISIPPSLLLDEALIDRAHTACAATMGDAAFLSRAKEIVQDVSIGPSDERIKAVESMIAGALSSGFTKDSHVTLGAYEGWILSSCAKVMTAERGIAKKSKEGPEFEMAKAVKKVRAIIGDRFFKKNWLPLETNPEVFNALGRQLGLHKEVEFYEVFGFDPDLLAMVPSPTSAVLVCFPLTDAYRKSAKGASASNTPDGLYFMRQTVPNACGTVALVHAFANTPGGPKTGGWLADFVSSTEGKTPMERACCLEEDETLATAHNDMASQGDTDVSKFTDSGPKSAYNVVLHFVCYVHCGGKIYELDGLKAGPVEVGSGCADELLRVAAQVVQKYAADAEEHRVTMMALAPCD